MPQMTEPDTPPAPLRMRRAVGALTPVVAQYARFLTIGLSNALVDLGTLNLLLVLHPTRDARSLLADNTLAVALAILNSYLWNTRWTFRATATRTRRQRVLFTLQALLNIVLNNLVLLGLSGLLPPAHGVWYLVGSDALKLVAMLVASTTSFVVLRTVVFRATPHQVRPARLHDTDGAAPAVTRPSAAAAGELEATALRRGTGHRTSESPAPEEAGEDSYARVGTRRGRVLRVADGAPFVAARP